MFIANNIAFILSGYVWCVYGYIFNMYTYILCAYICMMYSYVRAVYSWLCSKMISPHQTVSSCWLNLHVPCNSEKPVPYLHLQSFLLAFHLSPQGRPWHMSLSASLSPGIVWVRKLVKRWLLPPELRLPGFEWWWGSFLARRQCLEQLCSWAWWGKTLALVGNGMSQLA